MTTKDEQPAQCAPADDGVCEALDCPNHTAQQEPAGGTQVSKVWWDGEKLMAKPIPFVEFYKPAQNDIRNATLDEIALLIENYVEGYDYNYRELGLELAAEIQARKT